MPYPTNASLPVTVRHAYPSKKGQDAFRKVWTQTFNRTGDESQAFAEAHHAAQGVHGMIPNFVSRAKRPGGQL